MVLVGRGTGETKKRSLAFQPDMHPNEGLTYGFVCRDVPVVSRMIHFRSSGQFWPVFPLVSGRRVTGMSFSEVSEISAGALVARRSSICCARTDRRAA